MYKDTVVPLPSVTPRGSSTTEKDSESDSQICCLSSLLFLEVTTTLSATVKFCNDCYKLFFYIKYVYIYGYK